MAVIIRVYFVFYTGFGWQGCDTQMYLKMGHAILAKKPVSYFPNGFPLLIALVILVAGAKAKAVLVIINIAAQIITLFITERVLFKAGINKTVVIVAVFLSAFYPDQVSSVRFIMTEPLSAFLMMLAVYLIFKERYYTAGLAAYITYSFRPSLIFFAPVIILYLLLKYENYNAAKITSGFITGFVLFKTSEILGLTAPLGSSTQNILIAVQSYGYNINFFTNNYTNYQIEHPVATYLNFAFMHPIKYMEQRLLVLWSLWGPYVPTKLGLLSNILKGLRFPLFITAFFTFIYRNKFNKNFIFILFAPVLSLTIIHILFFADPRHTLTAEPFVILLAVYGLNKLLAYIKLKTKNLNGLSEASRN